MKKIIISTVVMGALVASAGIAFASPKLKVFGPNWIILSRVPLPNGGQNFATTHPYNAVDGMEFSLLPTGSGYTNYLFTNYNVDLTGKMITAEVNTAIDGGATFTSKPNAGATPPNVRLEFQSAAAGNYTPNDYWWSHAGAVILANAVGGITLIGDTTDRADWTNICGQPATDQTVYTGPDCVGGTYPGVSPYNGFTEALKNVKEVGFSFGGGSFFANGVGVDGGNATFGVTGFSIN